MAILGKCLLFYLKYPAEMERLYEPEEPKVEGLPDPDKLLQKIRRVGATASREAADFLELCAPRIEQHFRGISSRHEEGFNEALLGRRVFRHRKNNLEPLGLVSWWTPR